MPRVLLIEDSPTQAQQVSLFLEEAGFEVVVVGDAEKGYARLAQEQIDVVLTDLVLPGESGFDLCRRIKADSKLRRLPVVVMTVQADPLNVLRGLEAGADGFMTKNRGPDEIVGRLRRTLEKATAEPSDDGPPTRVVFLDGEFRLSVGKWQLLNVLLAAFEDVVSLNQQFQRTESELRQLNAQMHETLRSEQAALQQLRVAQSQLVQAEKLAALGQMVAGVAHEINNPLAFMSANLTVLQRDSEALRTVLDLYRQADSILATHAPDLLQRIKEMDEQLDLGYTLGNLPGLLTRSRDGAARIEKIVKGLREFARMEERELKSVDLNAGIESTVNIMQGEAKKRRVAIVLDLGKVPEVVCFPTKINQVVLNLIANALDACAEGGTVTVRTRVGQAFQPDDKTASTGVEVHVIDNGSGVDPTVADKIFDPFFTTKPLGKGTGLGLSISYGIVQDHGGRLTFTSAPGRETDFCLWLPPRPPGEAHG